MKTIASKSIRVIKSQTRSQLRLRLWNIDQPEFHADNLWDSRYSRITTYLSQKDCDVLVLTEANAAMDLPGYQSFFSKVSPFRNNSRSYEAPNRFHQVAIHSRLDLTSYPTTEPINGLHCSSEGSGARLHVYGNVVTIKDQWLKESTKRYSDRLTEQLDAIDKLPNMRCIVAGDFNLRVNWKKPSHQRVKELVTRRGWVWPTEDFETTVQHILHTPDLTTQITIDDTVLSPLSDHPFIGVGVESKDEFA